MAKNKVKKAPKLVWPCITGLLALICVFFAIWISYVGGPRIDTMSKNNIIVFWVAAAIFALLCIWRGIAYTRYQKKVAQK